jgi:hypothetical protein
MGYNTEPIRFARSPSGRIASSRSLPLMIAH